MKVYQLPEAVGARGRPDRQPAAESQRTYHRDWFVSTKKRQRLLWRPPAYQKKTALTEFSRPRSAGIIAVNPQRRRRADWR